MLCEERSTAWCLDHIIHGIRWDTNPVRGDDRTIFANIFPLNICNCKKLTNKKNDSVQEAEF